MKFVYPDIQPQFIHTQSTTNQMNLVNKLKQLIPIKQRHADVLKVIATTNALIYDCDSRVLSAHNTLNVILDKLISYLIIWGVKYVMYTIHSDDYLVNCTVHQVN